MNKKAIATALALGVASTASAQLALKGSDTLFEMTEEMLDLCEISPTVMTYAGGGSTGGQNQMLSATATQYVAPMSRFINSAGCSAAHPDAVPANDHRRQGFAHSLDAIAVFSDNKENTSCDTLRHSGSITVGDGNGDGSVVCPTCTAGNQFNFTMWQQVLRIVYSGRSGTFTYNECAFDAPSVTETPDCNSDLRNTLVNNWSDLFEEGAGCTDSECTQLKHAFRRDDISGTTDTFLNLLSLPAMFAGDSSFQGGIPYDTTAPAKLASFCNGSEFEDKDPIRRDCSLRGATTGTAGNPAGGENVCQRVAAKAGVAWGETVTVGPRTGALYPQLNSVWPTPTVVPPNTSTPGDLGLVLPIVMPLNADDQFANNNVCGSTFKLASMPPPVGGGQGCPNGQQRLGGSCFWPVDAAGNFGCVANRNTRPFPGIVIGGVNYQQRMDGRVYNLTPRLANGNIPTVLRKATPTSNPGTRQLLNVAFYRLHQLTAQPKPGSDPTVASGVTCRKDNDTAQIGCLVEASPCSVGYAGLAGLEIDANTGLPLANTNKALKVRSPLAGSGVTDPNDTVGFPDIVRRLLATPSNGATGTCPTYGIRYPLSRKLFFNTMVGFDNIPSNSSQTFLTDSAATDAELQLARCFSDRRFTDRAAKHAGFITLTASNCGDNVANPLPADPSLPFTTPVGCDLRDDSPGYEMSTCAAGENPGPL